MKKISLLFALMLLTVGLIAQQSFEAGYMLTNTDDTIWGGVAYRGKTNNCISCLFKNSSGEIEEYSPQFLSAYGFTDGEAYRSKPIKTDKNVDVEVFLQLILAGKVNLYVYYDSSYKERIFIEKDGLGINELRVVERHLDNTNDIYKHKEYIGYLKVYLADAKVKLDIKKTKLGLKEIQKLILKYNSGFYYPSKSYPLKMKTKKRKRPLVFGVGAGGIYAFGSYHFKGNHPSSISYDNTDFNSPGAFLNLSFKFPYFFQGKFSVNTGVGYQKLNYRVEYTWPIDTPRIIDYKQTNISIPLNFVYEILKTKVTPYVNIGAVFILNTDEHNSNKIVEEGERYLSVINIGNFYNNITYLLGAGVKYYPGKHIHIDFNLGYTSYFLFSFTTLVYEKKPNNEFLLVSSSSNALINRQLSTSLSFHYQF